MGERTLFGSWRDFLLAVLAKYFRFWHMISLFFKPLPCSQYIPQSSICVTPPPIPNTHTRSLPGFPEAIAFNHFGFNSRGYLRIVKNMLTREPFFKFYFVPRITSACMSLVFSAHACFNLVFVILWILLNYLVTCSLLWIFKSEIGERLQGMLQVRARLFHWQASG